MVHAENAEMIDVLTKQLMPKEKAPYYHAVSSRPVVEAESDAAAIYLAELVGSASL